MGSLQVFLVVLITSTVICERHPHQPKHDDACDSNPCHHGRCQEIHDHYVCHCNPGYTGKHCTDYVSHQQPQTQTQTAQPASPHVVSESSTTTLRTTVDQTTRAPTLTTSSAPRHVSISSTTAQKPATTSAKTSTTSSTHVYGSLHSPTCDKFSTVSELASQQIAQNRSAAQCPSGSYTSPEAFTLHNCQTSLPPFWKRGPNTMDTLHTLLIAAVSLVLLNTINCQSGFRVTVSETLLNKINQIEIDEIQRGLNGMRFDDMSQDGDLEYRISNIRVTDVDAITPTLDLRSGNVVNWRADVSSITVHANWWVRFAPDAIIKVEIFSGSGDLRVTAQTITVSLRIAISTHNGGLNIDLASCSTSIGNLDMHFTGGLLADLINLIKDPIKDVISGDLENMVCEIIQNVMTGLAEDMKTINTRYDINVIGIPLVLDNRFNDIKVDNNRITSYHKGAIRWNGMYFATRQSTQNLPVTTAALAVDLEEDTINSLLQATTLAGVLNGQFSYTEIVNKKIGEFYFTCPDGVLLCAGTLLHDRVTDYLDGVLALRWNVTEARLQILSGKIRGSLRGHVNFTAQTENAEEELFGATLDVMVPFQAKMSQQGLALRPAGVGGSLTIDSSRIGKILTQGLQTLINNKGFMSGIQTRILQMFQDFPSDYPINLPRDVYFRQSSIAIYQGVVRVEGDVCYKQHCTYVENNSWVGNLGTESLMILDIIPTTTAAIPTAKMTTAIINANRSTSSSTDKNSQTVVAGQRSLRPSTEIWTLITVLSFSNVLFLL